MIQPANIQPDTPEPRDPRLLVPVPEAARPQLLKVLDALDARAPDEAVRQFLYGITHKLFPNDLGVVSWLVGATGKETAVRLVEAFAVHPCFNCHEGRSACAECGGNGRSAPGGVCESCLGFGRSFCDYCNGAGLAAIDVVPPGLRLDVVVARIRHAMTWAKSLLEQSLPAEDSTEPLQAGKACAKHIWALNRTLGVFDNAVMAVKGVIPAELRESPAAMRVLRISIHEAPSLDRQIRQTLELLSALMRRQAAGESVIERRAVTAQAAEFYLRLARESLAPTRLEHPFIHRVAQELAQAKPLKAAGLLAAEAGHRHTEITKT